MDKEKVIKEFELFIKEFHPACTSEGVELDMFREVLSLLKEQEAQRDYEASVEMAEYCERYEPTYNPEDGSM